MSLSQRMLALSASIGVSLYPSHAETGPGLIKCADQAMYGVKDAGKAGVRFFQPEATISS